MLGDAVRQRPDAVPEEDGGDLQDPAEGAVHGPAGGAVLPRARGEERVRRDLRLRPVRDYPVLESYNDGGSGRDILTGMDQADLRALVREREEIPRTRLTELWRTPDPAQWSQPSQTPSQRNVNLNSRLL